MSLRITEVLSKKDVKKYIDFPHDLYKDDAYYVPELFMAQKEMFDKKKYPFYEYGSARSFLAYRDNKIVGRISAIANHRYNEYHKSNIGFFGFFDCINDQSVANALFDEAISALAEFKFDGIMGPTNFTTNETAGLLVDGFEDAPKVMMTYNAPYYHDLVSNYGFVKEMDLLAYTIPTKTVSERHVKFCDALEERLKRKGITIRNINLKNFKSEVTKVKRIYNSAWENNWGFVPFTDAEFKHLADGLKMLVNPKFAFIAEHDGKAIGFAISLPNINEITKGFKKGRLLPFNIFKLLLGKNKTKEVRTVALGVQEDYRKKGIDAVFYAKSIIAAKELKLKAGEASWILENNPEMNNALENMGGKVYKTYRLFKKSLT